jgi:hypothetical protein
MVQGILCVLYTRTQHSVEDGTAIMVLIMGTKTAVIFTTVIIAIRDNFLVYDSTIFLHMHLLDVDNA